MLRSQAGIISQALSCNWISISDPLCFKTPEKSFCGCLEALYHHEKLKMAHV